MQPGKPLTAEEEQECLVFLKIMGINDPHHGFLSNRGYFGLFLGRLRPEQVSGKDHPDRREFKRLISLLSRIGVERLRELISEDLARPQLQTPPRPQKVEKRATGPERIPESSLRKRITESQLSRPLPPPSTPRQQTSTGKPKGARQSELTEMTDPLVPDDAGSASMFRRLHLPEPHAHAKHSKDFTTPYATKKPAEAEHRQELGADGKPRPQFSRDIQAVAPTEGAKNRLSELGHAETAKEAVKLTLEFQHKGHYHDAHYVIVDYLMNHPLSQEAFQAGVNVIREASRFDCDKRIPPFNMLYECEELAAVLVRKIPDITRLKAGADEYTTMLYHLVQIIYKTWTGHCCAMLEYKYRMSSTQWIQRNWLEPLEFGCLLDVMRMGVRSRLPLDLLRFIYINVKKAALIGEQVIAHENKKAKFLGDILRTIASPTKDVIPDLQFEIYREIVHAYLRAGDTQNAFIFTHHALLLRKNDKEMREIKEELSQRGASKGRK